MSDMMIKNTLVKIKGHLPYVGDMEGKVLLNSMASVEQAGSQYSRPP